MATAVPTQVSPKEYKCKITVLKRTIEKDFVQQYKNGEGALCSVVSEGQEFIVQSPWVKPEGFCDWAWADIRSTILLVCYGTFDLMIRCCTDGFKPVFFKLERLDS